MDEALALENAIVSVKGIDGDTHVERQVFEGVKGIDRVCGIQGDLEFNVNVSRGGIYEDSGAAVAIPVRAQQHGEGDRELWIPVGHRRHDPRVSVGLP